MNEGNDQSHNDLLQKLLLSQDGESLNDDEVLDETVLFFVSQNFYLLLEISLTFPRLPVTRQLPIPCVGFYITLGIFLQ